jgi:hypothetical protein
MKYKLWFLLAGTGLSFCVEASFEWEHYDQEDFDSACEKLAKSLNSSFGWSERVDDGQDGDEA